MVQSWESDATRTLYDAAFWSELQDGLKSVLSDANFERMLAMANHAAEIPLEKPSAIVQVIAKQSGLHDGERDAILDALIAGGDPSAWGLSQAVTLISQRAENYDRATDLEELGGRIITLPQSEWRVIADEARSLVKAA